MFSILIVRLTNFKCFHQIHTNVTWIITVENQLKKENLLLENREKYPKCVKYKLHIFEDASIG